MEIEDGRSAAARARRGHRPPQDLSLAPKGLIRFAVLRLLLDEPMSGGRVVAEIRARTRGVWRPSPGSIYPLLGWMVKRGYIQPHDTKAGSKRYRLTDDGRELLRRQMGVLLERLPWVDLLLSFPHVFVEGAEESADLYEGLRRVLAQVNDLIDHVRVARDQEAASAARAELERVAKHLAGLGRRLHEDRRASPITRAERLGSD